MKNRSLMKYNIVMIISVVIIFIMLIIICLSVNKMKNIGVSSNDIKELDVIKISENSMTWDTSKDLNIFANKEFDGENIITPNSQGNYKFVVDNTINKNVTYNINFNEYNEKKVNMKYKIKLNNAYVVGNENKWVGLDEIDLNNLIITSNSKSIYTIEWKWEETENDEEIGRSSVIKQENYKLFISFTAISIGEEKKV